MLIFVNIYVGQCSFDCIFNRGQININVRPTNLMCVCVKLSLDSNLGVVLLARSTTHRTQHWRREWDAVIDMETATRDANELHIMCDSKSVHKVYHARNSNKCSRNSSEFLDSHQNRELKPVRVKTRRTFIGRCFRCRSPFHFADACPDKDKTCKKCKFKGHTETHYRTKLKKNLRQVTGETEIYTININESKDKITLNVYRCMHFCYVSQFLKVSPQTKIEHSNVILRVVGGELIKPVFEATVVVKYKDQVKVKKLYLCDRKVDPRFGVDWFRDFRLD
ncbi:hypothetical protein AVEN_23603-1 [Araneus ventricosus]|uniref:CCHC-type domain-containing protein n=1 Tax=Araneus ventricosus TaxID=182803 RepID=A0A4Y2BGZ8_ARAVE|nr:hypothetical protein AVEN_23603-1 [Araneus ventricosus]